MGHDDKHPHQHHPRSGVIGAMGSFHKALVPTAALAIALVGALNPGLAHARGDVRWSVSIGVPAVPAAVYVEPAPVYMVPPPPVYYAPPPRPVYVMQPAPVVYGPPAYGYYDRPYRDGYRRYHHHEHRGYRDSDRDGVPDRYDRRPGDPWRR